MIVSASRRTDIPALYADWFFQRLRAGYALTRNPMNAAQIRRVELGPEAVDGFVFWTKNPLPILSRLPALSAYAYYFQFTCTAYGPDIEEGLPSKDDVLIPTLMRLSDRIGPERVVWRYDPIFFSDVYTMERHMERFDAIAQRLSGYTEQCVISFLDVYAKMIKRMEAKGMRAVTDGEKGALAVALSESARNAGMRLSACAEAIDLSSYGISRARCVDAALLERISGRPIRVPKDQSQRPECGCAKSVDIGAYDTCVHACAYCYAVRSPQAALKYYKEKHTPQSEFM